MVYENGALKEPEGPGLGVKLDQNKLEAYHQVYEWYAAASEQGGQAGEPVHTKARW